MPILKLTKRNVDAIKPEARPRYYFDSEIPGFFIRVMPTGLKSWGLEYRAGVGRRAPKRRFTISQHGKLTPEMARRRAKELAGHVANGGDPAAQKAADAKEMNITQLIALYDQHGCFVQRGKRRGEPMKARTRAYTVARLLHHVVPLLGKKRVKDIHAGDIEVFVRDVAAGKTSKDEKLGPRRRIIVRGGEGAARKVVRDLSAVFSFAMRRDIIISNPCNNAAVRKTDNQNDRYLTLDEVRSLGRAFDVLEIKGINPKALNIARLWALTGCRRDEISALRWSEVDLNRALLMLDASKTGKSIRPLGTAACALLASIERDAESQFVFPSEKGDGHYQGTKRIWPMAIKTANLPGVTPHTLRHTMGSTATSNGETLALTGAILGHANPRSTSLYAHVQNDPAKRAANRVSRKISDALGSKKILPMEAIQRKTRFG